MLDPPLVRRIASQMQRRVGHHCPITVKCRIGADERDKYEHLCEFINEVRSAGVRKFIGKDRLIKHVYSNVHSASCFCLDIPLKLFLQFFFVVKSMRGSVT